MLKPYMTLNDAKATVESVVGASKGIYDSLKNVIKVVDGICWGITHPSQVFEMIQGASVNVTILLFIALILLRQMGFDVGKYIGLLFFIFILLMVL